MKERPPKQRGIITFIFCLLIAMAGWLFIALGREYTFNTQARMRYYNMPVGKSYVPKQGDTLDVTVQANGWQLLIDKFSTALPVVNVSLATLSSSDEVVLGRQKTEINKRAGDRKHFVSFSPDTLKYDFSRQVSKKVPVIIVEQLTFAKQHGMFSAPQTATQYVSVSGAREVVEKVKYVYTDTIKARALAADIDMAVQLRPPAGVSVVPKHINVKLKVEQYTEKSLEVPVKGLIPVKGLHDLVTNYKLLPDRVTITVQVPLRKYNVTDAESFDAVADFNIADINKPETKLPVRVLRRPSWVRLTEVRPAYLDYIIEK